MIVRIQSIHFDASEQLQAFIQKKAAKLEKFYDDIEKVEVSLKVVKPETAENKEAGVKVLVPNGELYANKVCDTFEEAVDLCLEALEIFYFFHLLNIHDPGILHIQHKLDCVHSFQPNLFQTHHQIFYF